MLQKIEGQEIMTMDEAKTKYSDKKFLFVYTDDVAEYWREDRIGYVSYIYDKFYEQSNIPREALTGLPCAFAFGYKVVYPPNIDRMLGPND